jgi:DNA (cytosine-5)-methyltransferase 1
MNEKPTHVDLCSGIGGFALAFGRAGFETIAFAEIDQACAVHLAQKWPRVPNHGDIRNFPAVECNVLTCGDPCQPFSVAGKRKGAADDRYLWPSVLAALERSQADFFLGENVVNSANMVLARRFDDLEALGYQPVAFDLPSCSLGLQSVERHVWLVAARESDRFKIRIARPDAPDDAFQKFLRSHPGKHRGGMLPEPRTLRSGQGHTSRVHAIGNAAPPPIIEVFACAMMVCYR